MADGNCKQLHHDIHICISVVCVCLLPTRLPTDARTRKAYACAALAALALALAAHLARQRASPLCRTMGPFLVLPKVMVAAWLQRRPTSENCRLLPDALNCRSMCVSHRPRVLLLLRTHLEKDTPSNCLRQCRPPRPQSETIAQEEARCPGSTNESQASLRAAW